jgi:hypothetical protein
MGDMTELFARLRVTDLSAFLAAHAEGAAAAGFSPVDVRKRYLPYSFRGFLPPSPKMTEAYLRMAPAHWILGKQYLCIADRP